MAVAQSHLCSLTHILKLPLPCTRSSTTEPVGTRGPLPCTRRRPPARTQKSLTVTHREGGHVEALHQGSNSPRPSQNHTPPTAITTATHRLCHRTRHPEVRHAQARAPPRGHRHVHPVLYLVGNGEHQTMPGSQVVSVTHAGPVPGHIDSEAGACGPAHLAAGALIPHGKEGAVIIPVQGDVQHAAGAGKGTAAGEWPLAPLRCAWPPFPTTPRPLPQPLTWGLPQICAEFHYRDGRPSPL